MIRGRYTQEDINKISDAINEILITNLEWKYKNPTIRNIPNFSIDENRYKRDFVIFAQTNPNYSIDQLISKFRKEKIIDPDKKDSSYFDILPNLGSALTSAETVTNLTVGNLTKIFKKYLTVNNIVLSAALLAQFGVAKAAIGGNPNDCISGNANSGSNNNCPGAISPYLTTSASPAQTTLANFLSTTAVMCIVNKLNRRVIDCNPDNKTVIADDTTSIDENDNITSIDEDENDDTTSIDENENDENDNITSIDDDTSSITDTEEFTSTTEINTTSTNGTIQSTIRTTTPNGCDLRNIIITRKNNKNNREFIVTKYNDDNSKTIFKGIIINSPKTTVIDFQKGNTKILCTIQTSEIDGSFIISSPLTSHELICSSYMGSLSRKSSREDVAIAIAMSLGAQENLQTIVKAKHGLLSKNADQDAKLIKDFLRIDENTKEIMARSVRTSSEVEKKLLDLKETNLDLDNVLHNLNNHHIRVSVNIPGNPCITSSATSGLGTTLPITTTTTPPPNTPSPPEQSVPESKNPLAGLIGGGVAGGLFLGGLCIAATVFCRRKIRMAQDRANEQIDPVAVAQGEAVAHGAVVAQGEAVAHGAAVAQGEARLPATGDVAYVNKPPQAEILPRRTDSLHASQNEISSGSA